MMPVLVQAQLMQAELAQAQLLQAQLLQSQLLQSKLLQQQQTPDAKTLINIPGAPGKKFDRAAPARRNNKPAPVEQVDDASLANRLARDLVQDVGSKRQRALAMLRERKGAVYTQALASSISQLSGEARGLARAALADRLSRMKATTLKDYLNGDDFESARAAALAAAMKNERELIPDLITVLEKNPESPVVPAVRAALKSMSERDFGPAPLASRDDRVRAVSAWKDWWAQAGTR